MQLRDHAGVKGKRDAYPFDPRLLKIDPAYNVRDLGSPDAIEKLAELKESIRANGVRTPLEVRLAGEDVFIVAGHRRHKAVMELISEGAEIETVLVLHEAKGTNDAERALNLIISNSGEPLKPLEVAEVVRRLVNYGWTDAQIMTRLGWKSTASVKQHLDMLAMPAAVQQQVRDGEVSVSTALHVVKEARRDAKTDPAFAAELIANAAEEQRRLGKKGRATPKATRKALDKARPPKPSAPAAPVEPVAAHTQSPEPDSELPSGLPAQNNTVHAERPAPMFVEPNLATAPAPALHHHATRFIVEAASMDLLALAQTHLNFSNETPVEMPDWEDEESYRLRALAVIDAIGNLKFIDGWEAARDATFITHEVRTDDESQDAASEAA